MKIYIALLCFFGMSITYAQNVKIEGVIQDDIGVLEMANVMLINKQTKAMEGYSITNGSGKYQLNAPANTVLILKVSYIGYLPFEEELTLGTTNIQKNIVLDQGTQLNEIEIVKEMPVSIKGDTIVYNTDSFTTGTERKLEDVLKKLPGVEVNADGEIQVEGKTVQKLMIEGKDFFDGDTKLAVKNIPADALDKVQVLRNYNEVQNMKGLENNEENLAINIKLKEGKKNFWFGDLTAGIGVGHKESRYVVNPKVFYYSPKYSLNFIGNMNNIGDLPLTMQDFFKITGGFRNIMGRSGTGFNVSSNSLNIAGLRNNRAKEIETQFGAANFSYNPSKAWTLSGFAIFSGNETDTQTISRTNRTDNLPDGSVIQIQENRTAMSTQKTDMGLFKLSSSYIPSAKVHFDYDVMSKVSNQREYNGTYSNLLSDIYTDKKQKPLSFNQNLNYYYTPSKNHTFAILAQHLYQEEDPFYNADLANQPFELSGYVANQLRNHVVQDQFVKTNKMDVKGDYYYNVTPKQILNISLGNTYSYQNFDSKIFQILDNQQVNALDDISLTNDVDYAFNDAFAGVHYRMMLGKFTLNPGVTFHNYQMTDRQLGSKNKNNFNKVLPDFNALWQIKKSETLSYDFRLSNNFTDINSLAQGYIFSSYSSLFMGNRNLENSTSQVHSLRYFKFNMFNFENIFANLSYSKQTDGIKSITQFDGVNQTSTRINMPSNFADESFSGSASYGRSFWRYYKGTLSANASWGKYNNIRRYDLSGVATDVVQTTESFSQTYSSKFSTNFKRMPNLEVGYSFSMNDNFADKILIHSPSARLDYYFWDAFSFVAEYTYYSNTNRAKTISNQYDFLTANLIYKPESSKWEWKLSGTNLLNTKSLDNSSFSEVGGISNYSSYIVQPLYLILSINYKL